MEEFPLDSPFASFAIASHDPLRDATKGQRYVCSKCQKSVRFFCYRCHTMAKELHEAIPQVLLPIPLAIVKDVRELDGKSTAVHARLLTCHQDPSAVSIVNFDCKLGTNGGLDESQYSPSECVLLFPDAQAVPVEGVDWKRVRKVIVVDGTWRQAKSMVKSPLLAKLPKVHLDETNVSRFWRYQRHGPHCLASIEAIFQLYCEIEPQRVHEFDNLLYFFSFFYHLIQLEYKSHPEKRFNSRHCPDYIK